jgi:diguanylate cyclase|tara:strand:+ start:1653 stop:2150 length:498 start_codon:yes stop_codon:yes gene_type:complete
VHDVDRLRDPATGLSGQRHFEIVLDFLFPIAHRGVTLTVALFGIDEGNWADDHANPDQVVTDLGSTIGGVTRNSDLVARFEEDTFICLLPLCNIQGGLVFADRIRDALEDFTKRTGTTVSAGIASHRGEGDGTVADMLESLRGALVAARLAGGDRVEISSEGWSV